MQMQGKHQVLQVVITTGEVTALHQQCEQRQHEEHDRGESINHRFRQSCWVLLHGLQVFFQPLLQLRLYRIQRLFSGIYRILFLSLVSRCRSSVHRTFMRRRRLARIRVKYLFTQVQAAPTSQERRSGGLHVAIFSLFPAIFRLLVFDSVKLTRF